LNGELIRSISIIRKQSDNLSNRVKERRKILLDWIAFPYKQQAKSQKILGGLVLLGQEPITHHLCDGLLTVFIIVRVNLAAFSPVPKFHTSFVSHNDTAVILAIQTNPRFSYLLKNKAAAREKRELGRTPTRIRKSYRYRVNTQHPYPLKNNEKREGGRRVDSFALAPFLMQLL